MKTKNIILFSIAATLLFASDVEGMERPLSLNEKPWIKICTGLFSSKSKQLKTLEENKQCNVKITAYHQTSIEHLRKLFKKIIEKEHKLKHLSITDSYNKITQNINWKMINDLEKLKFVDSTKLKTETFRCILKGNPKLRYLDLSTCTGFSLEEADWENIKNIQTLYLPRDKTKASVLDDIFSNCPMLESIGYLDTDCISTKDVSWNEARNLKNIAVYIDPSPSVTNFFNPILEYCTTLESIKIENQGSNVIPLQDIHWGKAENLKRIDFGHYARITLEGAENILKNCKNLTFLKAKILHPVIGKHSFNTEEGERMDFKFRMGIAQLKKQCINKKVELVLTISC